MPALTKWYKMVDDFVLQVVPPFIEIFEEDSHRPLLFKEGSIIPVIAEISLPKPLNTNNLRKVPLDLWVLPHSVYNASFASGDLFWDDGDSIDTIEKGTYNYYTFKFEKCKLVVSAAHFGFKDTAGEHTLKLGHVLIALPHGSTHFEVDKVTVDGVEVKFTRSNQAVRFAVNVDLIHKLSKPLTIEISNKSHGCVFDRPSLKK